jgi:hypothetical protein
MTRMQEIPWVEKIPLHEQEVQIQERLQRPGRLNLYQLTWLRPLIESRWPQLILASRPFPVSYSPSQWVYLAPW